MWKSTFPFPMYLLPNSVSPSPLPSLPFPSLPEGGGGAPLSSLHTTSQSILFHLTSLGLNYKYYIYYIYIIYVLYVIWNISYIYPKFLKHNTRRLKVIYNVAHNPYPINYTGKLKMSYQKINKCSDWSIEVKLPALLGIYDRPGL